MLGGRDNSQRPLNQRTVNHGSVSALLICARRNPTDAPVDQSFRCCPICEYKIARHQPGAARLRGNVK